MCYILQDIVEQLPAPYEVDPLEWGCTLATILNTRSALLTLITKIDTWHMTLANTYQHQSPVLGAAGDAVRTGRE